MNECWEWKGNRSTSGGYGLKFIAGRHVRLHRVAYEWAFGPIPPGLFVLHKCDNPPCVNPDHLFLGTQKDNSTDCTTKGRHKNQRVTHCRRGHAYSGNNVRMVRNGTARVCRECDKRGDRERYWRKKLERAPRSDPDDIPDEDVFTYDDDPPESP